MQRRRFMQLPAAGLAASALGQHAHAAPGPRSPLRWKPRRGIRQPNILVAVLDDIGFADLGCYGAEHHTPCVDALAAGGTRLSNFHVTALCAPTRACLMTGRNAHSVGVGNIAEWGRDLPAYRGLMRDDAATMAEVLREQDYTTLAVGKWHLSALDDQNAAAPFNHWPTGRGFDRWYGFHGNAMDHWHPEMFENTVAAYPEKTPGYHLSEDLADRSIAYLGDHLAAAPEKPFFMYLAFGACHYPFHVPQADIERQKGRYDGGWDAVRAARFERQQELGVVPAGTRLAPRNPGIPAWSELSADRRAVAAHGQEVYAAFLEHTDAQLARVIEFLRAENELNDTIVVVMSDNGAAGGGGTVEGILDVRRSYYDDVSYDEVAATMPRLGTDDSYGMYGSGWAQASNTPLRWFKADTYGGGTRAPLIVHWPAGGVTADARRHQYAHVVDVLPTLLEMSNLTPPATVRRQPVLPMQGTSFAHALDHATAETNKTVQYFETAGDRAVWADGWKAVTKHAPGSNYDSEPWSLYHTATDFAELNDRAEEQPERLAMLKALWLAEARRDGVLPMADDLFDLYTKVVPPPRSIYRFYPRMDRLDRLSAPPIEQYPARLRADVELNGRRDNGVVLASGDSGAGYELYLKDGYLHFDYVFARREIYRGRSKRRLAASVTSLGFDLAHRSDGTHLLALSADEQTVGELVLPKMWQVYSPNSGIRCGENTQSPIGRAYRPPFTFSGTLQRVTITLNLDTEARSA